MAYLGKGFIKATHKEAEANKKLKRTKSSFEVNDKFNWIDSKIEMKHPEEVNRLKKLISKNDEIIIIYK